MGRVADFRVLFASQGKGLGGGGGVHVSIKNLDGKKPQEAASRPFFCSFLMKKIAYGSSSARMKIRTARDLSKPVRVSTIFFLIFLIFFFF